MKYIDDLRNELIKRNVKRDIIDDIIADHEEMIQEAFHEGLQETDLVTKFGDPIKLASELASNSNTIEASTTPSTQPWKTFVLTSNQLSFDIKLLNDDITFLQTTENELLITAKGNQRLLDEYTCKLEDGILTLHSPKHPKTTLFGNHRGSLQFTCYLPKDVLLTTGKLTTVNGDTSINQIKASQIEINTTNGDLHLSQSTFGRLKYNTVNGDVHLVQIESSTIIGSSVSADVTIKESTIKELYLNTVSGDASIHHTTAEIAELSSVSGDLLGNEFYPKRISLKSVSGDIKLTNKKPETMEIIRQSTVSGTITITTPQELSN